MCINSENNGKKPEYNPSRYHGHGQAIITGEQNQRKTLAINKDSTQICMFHYFAQSIFIQIFFGFRFELQRAQPCWFAFYHWKAGSLQIFYFCHTFQPCLQKQLTTKWQHTIMFQTLQDKKLKKASKKLLCIFFIPLPLIRACVASSIWFPFNIKPCLCGGVGGGGRGNTCKKPCYAKLAVRDIALLYCRI